MKASKILELIRNNDYSGLFKRLYNNKSGAMQQRWCKIVESFIELFGDRDAMMFSVPGRSEVCGNHTDHNNGAVIAAAIDLDIVGIAAKNNNNEISVISEGYGEIKTNTAQKAASVKKGSPESLIAGMCSAFADYGYKHGGFCSVCSSDVLRGSGLSSSAAFEVYIGTVLNHLFNDGEIDAVSVAKAAQRAENIFFGKPCGLMDQTACSVGGFVFIDFENGEKPEVRKLDRTLSSFGYMLCITDTGGNHAALTDDYASIPAEMRAVAKALGKDSLRSVDENIFRKSIPMLREKCGDRAVLRAIHFFSENKRVFAAAQAISDGNIGVFLENIRLSGDSSFKYLQNIYTNKNVTEQGLSLALALSGDTVCRVHGGGFAGTIQAFVKQNELAAYKEKMESVFGKDSCRCLAVRADGAVRAI